MNIGIDIDDTISKTCEECDILAKEYTEKILKRKFNINCKKEILDPMWARDLYNWTPEEDKEFWNIYYEIIVDNVKPKEDVSNIINKLYENNEIIIITARWDKENQIIEKKTREWLQKNNIQYNKFYIGHKDKRNIVRENNIDLFIDDSYTTCKEVSEMNVKTFLMNSRINKKNNDNKIERVFSWKDISQKIKEGI